MAKRDIPSFDQETLDPAAYGLRVWETLETFLMSYLLDPGVQIQLTEAVVRELSGTDDALGIMAADQLVVRAIEDLIGTTAPSEDTTFDYTRAIAAGASLEFLVRYARKVNPRVLPPEVLPDQKMMDVILTVTQALK